MPAAGKVTSDEVVPAATFPVVQVPVPASAVAVCGSVVVLCHAAVPPTGTLMVAG